MKSSPLVYISADASDVAGPLYTLSRLITQLGGVPVSSHYTPAAGEYDWGSVRQVIDRCDVFLLLVGDSYGQQAATGESYIHREAVYAKGKKMPVVALLKNVELKNLKDVDVSRLRSLHKLMMSGVFKYWINVEDLNLIGRHVLRDHLKPQLGLASATKAAEAAIEPPMLTRIEETFNEDEAYPLRFTGKVFAHGNCHDVSCQIQLTWESTFINIASAMTSPVTEDRMKSILEDFVEEYYRAQFLEKVADGHALADVRCNTMEFQRLKAFLKGVGFIENVAGHGGGLRHYWQLTRAGELKLNKLLMRGAGTAV